MTSTIKVNNIQNQCGQNIINENSNTITIGASGDTIALASGASQSGFGREGSVDWQTTIKTGDFTAVNGEGYFINTTSGTITMTLPSSPSAGDIVAIKDYANTFDTNNLTIGRNGQPISGTSSDAVISTEGQAITLVYGDATKGWQSVAASTESDLPKPGYVTASGGNSTATCGDFKIHTFTGPGTFTVSNAGNSAGSNSVEYIVVAGGGGSGAGGGGAGGFRFASSSLAPATYPAKPLAAPANLSVTAQGYPITVGGGGPGSTQGSAPGDNGCRGSNSVFSTITSTGGGGAAAWNFPGTTTNMPGGSGGGGGARVSGGTGGSGNTPPVSPPQGNNGGTTDGGGVEYAGSGGGGALAVGVSSPGTSTGANGGVGAGVPSAFGTSGESNGGFYYFAGGGGGSGRNPGSCAGAGGLGGGKAGTIPGTSPGPAGTANTGGGAGGGGYSVSGDNYATGGAGGSGIVIIRYKFQN